MFIARFLMPSGEVSVSSSSKPALEQFMERVSATHLPEEQRPQGLALTILEVTR
jgi:hypothetical protein